MVRPIDLQDNFSKAPLAGRLQHLQQDASEMALRQSTQDKAQQQRIDRSRPLPAGDSQKVEIPPKEERRQQHGERRDNQDSPASEDRSRPAVSENEAGSHIDIIV